MIYVAVAVAVALIWLVWMPLCFRMKKTENRIAEWIFKVIPTLMAAGFAGYACFALGQRSAYAELIFAGLCVCALADWVLEVRFEVGGALFFAGHVLYVLALALYRMLSWWSLTVGVIALAAIWYFLSHYKDGRPVGLLGVGLCIYGCALAALLGLSLPLPFLAPSTSTYLAAAGAALFVVSDLTLCHNTIRQKPSHWHFMSLGTYYMGQLLLALSAFPDL